MRRHKDSIWNIPNTDLTWEQVNSSLLMDLRDELKTLNVNVRLIKDILMCPNAMDIPHLLRSIKRNTTKKKRVIKS